MTPSSVWQDWRDSVRAVLPDSSLPLGRALADFSFCVPLARHCGLARAATLLPSAARVPSTERRFARLLANPRFDAWAAQLAISARLLARYRGQTLFLALDETSQGHRRTAAGVWQEAVRVQSLRLLVRHRAVPVLQAVYPPGAPPRPVPALLSALLRAVAAIMPPDTSVVLLVDRGLCWPDVLRTCRAVGWHFLVRCQSQTRFRLADGTEYPIAALLATVGQWLGAGAAFKKAGWLACNLVAVRRTTGKEDWLLLTDLPPTSQRPAQYRARMWIEESFRDDKSSGFQWQRSRVCDPQHVARLLVVLQLAMLLTLFTGAQVVRRGLRTLLDRPDRTTLSLFSLGLRWLQRTLQWGLPFPVHLALAPPA